MRTALPLLLIVLVLASQALGEAAPSGRPIVLGYFAEWEQQYTVDDIPANKLTHINYAFAVLREGKIALKDEKAALKHFGNLRELKKKHPALRTLISVGGWADSNGFSEAALTNASRKTFADSCAAFVQKHGFDGVDIDWEFPVTGGMPGNSKRPEDKQNFTALLAAIRSSLDALSESENKRYLLTIAASASSGHRITELDKIHPSLDFLNLMTYDFFGFWSETTGFNSALHPVPGHPEQASIEQSLNTYLKAGVPREKIVVGVPFYGRGWRGVADVDHGLFQPHDQKPIEGTHENGYWSYRGLKKRSFEKAPRFWSDTAAVPWLYDASQKLMISYDDPQSMKLKGAFAREKKLAGVMFWELSGDDEQSSLLNALIHGLEE